MADASDEKTGVTLFDPHWARARGRQFHRLSLFDLERAEIEGVGGIYVVWHSGVRPRWIFVGKSADLAATFAELRDDEDVREYEIHGGVRFIWSLIRDAHQDGVLRFLHTIMKPLIPNPDAPGDDVVPIPVYAPKAGASSG